MPVKVWVGRFSVVDGQPQEEGPLLRSFPRQRPDEEEDEVYVLVEPVAEGSKEYYSQLVDAVGRMYQQDTLSITGAILRAVQTAHRQLREWNDRSLREQRVAAGVTCLAVRSRTAYLAQIGPAVGFHVGDGHFQRYVPDAPAAEPLGLTLQAEPTFHRFELSPGDLLLVASTGIERVIDEETLRSILLRGGDEALVEAFRIARDQPDFSLVLLACVVEPEEEQQPAPTPAVAETSASESPAPLPESSAPALTREAGLTSELLVVPQYGVTQPPPLIEQRPEIVVPPATASISPEDALVAAPPVGFGQPKVSLKDAEASVHYRRATGLSALIPNISPVAVAIALIMIITGLLAWQIIPRALQDSKEERFQSSVAKAESSLNEALAATDTTEKRNLLQEAEAALTRAQGYKPADPQVKDLDGRIKAALTQLNAELVLPDLEQVVDISGRVAGPVSSKDLAIGGGGAYFLDRDQGRVIAVSLLVPNPEPFILYQEGDLVGTEVTGKAHSIAWAEELGSLLIMDDQRRLISVAPPSPGRDVPVRDANAWGSEDGIGYVDGNLYILDRDGDQVWQYPASQDGFDSERLGLLPTSDLDKAVEMTAGDPVYLAFSDGSIMRFSGGVAEPFSQAGIDRWMSSPGSLTPAPSAGMVLVADRGNARIVVFSPDGTFKQQLVSPKLTDLRAIAVDDQARLLYILNGGTLYRTPLPALP